MNGSFIKIQEGLQRVLNKFPHFSVKATANIAKHMAVCDRILEIIRNLQFVGAEKCQWGIHGLSFKIQEGSQRVLN